MPKLSAHQSSITTKLLFIGDSGAGKTGALAALAADGYNLRIMDLDNGLDVLANLLQDPSSPYLDRKRFPRGEAALDRVQFETITDPMKNSNGKLVPSKATVWQRAVKLLIEWPELGPITSWTPQDVLVIDSLTLLSKAAMNYQLAMNGRLAGRPEQSDWYGGQQLVEGLIEMLYDESVRCNIVLCSHITYIGEDNGPQHGYPMTLGKALSPKIGRYFNTMLLAKTSGSGTAVRRKILTQSTALVELKNTVPTTVKPDYPLETGLAEYFRVIRGEPPLALG